MATVNPLMIKLGYIHEVASGDYLSPLVMGSGSPGLTTFLRGDGKWVESANSVMDEVICFNGTSPELVFYDDGVVKVYGG